MKLLKMGLLDFGGKREGVGKEQIWDAAAPRAPWQHVKICYIVTVSHTAETLRALNGLIHEFSATTTAKICGERAQMSPAASCLKSIDNTCDNKL